MTMLEAFTELIEGLRTVNQALDHLVWAINEDNPADEEASPASRLDDSVQELQGWVVEASCALADLRSAPQDSPPLYRTLVDCQRRCGQIVEQFNSRLSAPETTAWLTTLTRAEEQPWRSWAWGVRDALEACRGPIYGLNGALLRCWSELAEHSEAPNLTVTALISSANPSPVSRHQNRIIAQPSVE